ncbi:hypothetical protein [Streptomyces huasconensis]|uniref:hypothetical protein n=1 Tax=Streptomyces huasconensis TaxID=1854574 RepID=UPI0037013C70
MSDAYARIPEQCRDRLTALAAAEGMSLRAYLAQLAETLLTPDECNGCAPTHAEELDLDSELDRGLARAAAR